MTVVSVTVGGFQSYREPQTIELHEHLTLLAGRNNVGKSAFLRALGIFRSAAPSGGARRMRLRWTWSLSTDELLSRFSGEVERALRESLAEQTVILTAEWQQLDADSSVTAQQLHCARLGMPTAGWAGAAAPGAKGGWHAGPFAGAANGFDEMMSVASGLGRSVFHLAPRRVDQGPQFITPQSGLTEEARNLTAVLSHLQLNRPKAGFERLVAFMKDAFPDIVGLTVRHVGDTAGGGYHSEPAVLYEGGPEDGIPLQYCGTGVEQMLAMGAAVLTRPPGSLILIDEPQAFLHPQAERSLLAFLDEHPEHQYVVATHSPQLLNARELTQSRLLTLEDGATRVTSSAESEVLLSELGVTAADLWLTDRILWVEGPSDVAVLELMAARTLSPAARAGLAIHPMPEGVSRFAGRSEQKTRSTFRFCEEVVAAVRPLPMRMRFLFDADEKSDAFRQHIRESSGNRAVFLPVRELENLFLNPRVVHADLARRAQLLDRGAPSRDAVTDKLDEVLGRHTDEKLFPHGVEGGADPVTVARGSAVLDELMWHFTASTYQKVSDAVELAQVALEVEPAVLRPLVDVLSQMTTD